MSNDQHLKQSVLDELNWEPSVNSAHIGVTASDGVITFTGNAGTYSEKHAAETAALRVKDVRGVAEEIEVKFPFDVKHGDAEIAEAALHRLTRGSSVPKDAVKVTVNDGWLTLTGDVGWHFQKDAAAGSVRTLWGVSGVPNQVAIKPRPNAGDIKADIMSALTRPWFKPERVDVTALNGKVNNWSERAIAGTTAWAAPGVSAVVNDIRVS